mmetsp:Transcript_51505/g.103420  ORF Transcript_51505/g.103420 Transcript_51505/m.103420 type:complete len:235 (-) Transcript_51505:2-706(-)
MNRSVEPNSSSSRFDVVPSRVLSKNVRLVLAVSVCAWRGMGKHTRCTFPRHITSTDPTNRRRFARDRARSSRRCLPLLLAPPSSSPPPSLPLKRDSSSSESDDRASSRSSPTSSFLSSLVWFFEVFLSVSISVARKEPCRLLPPAERESVGVLFLASGGMEDGGVFANDGARRKACGGGGGALSIDASITRRSVIATSPSFPAAAEVSSPPLSSSPSSPSPSLSSSSSSSSSPL